MTLEVALIAAVGALVPAVTYLYFRQEKQAEETRKELKECRRDREKLHKMIAALVGHLERHSDVPKHRMILDRELREIEVEYQSLEE